MCIGTADIKELYVDDKHSWRVDKRYGCQFAVEPWREELPVTVKAVPAVPLAEVFRECLDAIDVISSAARFPAAVHGQDGVTHIDTS